MGKTGRIKLLALLVTLALALTALPFSALADDEVSLYNGDSIVDSRESGYLQTPAGHVGDTISIYIPVINTSGGTLTNVSCSLPVSSDVTTFPFESPAEGETTLDGKAYQIADAATSTLVAWNGDALDAGEHAYFKMDATFGSGASADYYKIPFTIKYDGGTSTVYVNVYCRGVDTSSSGSSSGGTSYKSKPKVIIEAYEFEQNPIYAGDVVQLRLVVANTSNREAVTNLQLDYACESGAVIPAPGGSSSIYLGTIPKNGVRALTVDLQIAPDAEAKSQVLAVTLSYEGTKNRSDFEEKASVNVPILQKARVRINDPVIYDDPWVGSTVSMGVTLYNLGKSPLYNCMVDVVSDSLTLEETYFGGNVASGSSMNADLSVTPNVGGDIDAKIRVTYEDVYGNQTEELLPLHMTVNEEAPSTVASPGDGMEAPSTQPTNGGAGWIIWTLIGAVVIAGLIVLFIRLKKKRERALEDL
ncbi:MAG: hypothetical protein VB034_05140 [Eubacteriales bacterium]|nr:hypothetical protein [Eubacteriales bacterium]